MRIPFASSRGQGRAQQLTAERLVNLYAEQAPQGSKSPVVVHGCPGLTRFCDDFARQSGVDYSQGWVDEALGTGLDAWDGQSLDLATDGTDVLSVGSGDSGGYTFLKSNNFARVIIPGWSTNKAQTCVYAPELGLWVVAGGGGCLSTSPDGLTWTKRTTGTSATLHSIDWGNGRFVVATNTADTLLTSTDGVNWSTVTVSGLGTPQSVLYGPGRWIVAADKSNDAYIAYSDNGSDWTIAPGPVLADMSAGARKIAYGNGVYVLIWTTALDVTSFNTIATSPDGVSWTSRQAPISDMQSVRWTGDFFTLTASKDSADNYGGIFTSTDGESWSELASGPTIGLDWISQSAIYTPGTGELWVSDQTSGLFRTPGVEVFTDASDDRPRGLHRTPRDGRLYLVAGQALYYIDSDGSVTSLGTIAGAGRVGIADNGTQLCIVTGSKGYIYDTANGLREISDKDFPGAATVTYLDGFFVFNNPGSGQAREQFFISSLRDGTVYDALDFASAESYPDDLKRVFADHSELLLFGSETIEIWFNAGAADFPFRRAQGSVIEQGLGATWSVAKCDETVFWLDNEGSVRRLQGNTPVRVSTHAIENAISKGDWENASAWSYVEEGHAFYVLTVPARNLSQTAGTYVFDAATGLWHERQSHERDYCRSGFYARAYGQHITCDHDIARLYVQSLDVHQEDGEHLIGEMIFPPVQADGERFIVDQLQLDCEVGAEGAGDPQVMLTTSGNQRSYSQTEQWRSMGKQGEYDKRVIWRRLGQHRSFTPRIRISAPVKRAIFAAYAKIRPTR